MNLHDIAPPQRGAYSYDEFLQIRRNVALAFPDIYEIEWVDGIVMERSAYANSIQYLHSGGIHSDMFLDSGFNLNDHQ